ncbi:TetR/AcrR family transcriptional regulator [Croceicoccus ponticola]|uniref:TetR/AcrR family transcriptional regulator n=1 Tax=Croceicoccus ponticola TaxID=2217664 RepID=A0A437GXL9_9SPHN|nr:TetR/AcrR family transcriptional regulator [Croceicoccus ponticola]RVQ67153.1 TetR/AcrR family transcriptional regulator [Croceicoccus ponticola]
MVVRQECDRLDRRREAILSAARVLFVSKGFEQTTLGDVVERAGGSLATVYKLFDNKEGLLEAVVFDRIVSGEEMIRRIVDEERDPAMALTRIAKELQRTLLDPDEIALVRVVIAHSIRNEMFAERFFSSTARCSRLALQEAFERWAGQGVKLAGEPRDLADLFIGMIVSDMQTQAISHGFDGTPTCDTIAFRLQFFLRGAGLAN